MRFVKARIQHVLNSVGYTAIKTVDHVALRGQRDELQAERDQARAERDELYAERDQARAEGLSQNRG